MNYPMIESLSVAISVVGSAIGCIWMWIKKANHSQVQDTLKIAKEADTELKGLLEAKIHFLETDLRNFKDNTRKDFDHMKETSTNEIKGLGEKIELLRDELKSQHVGILGLLSKLIDKS